MYYSLWLPFHGHNKKMSLYNKKMRARTNVYDDDDYPELSRAPNPSLEQYLGVTKRKNKKQKEEDLLALLDMIRLGVTH